MAHVPRSLDHAVDDARENPLRADGGFQLSGRSQLAQYAVEGRDAADRGARLEGIRNSLGSDEIGERAFARMLERTQTGIPDEGRDGAALMRGALGAMIANGTFDARDARAFAEHSAAALSDLTRGSDGLNPALGVAGRNASDYFQGLGPSPRSEDARLAFVSATLEIARERAFDPGVASALNAQAANVMAELNPHHLRDVLHEIASHGADKTTDEHGLAVFAKSALKGEVDRLASFPGAFPPNGLANVIGEVAQHGNGGRPLPAGSDAGHLADLFTGAMQYVDSVGGSRADELLRSGDAQTGLRRSLNDATGTGFVAILRANTVRAGEGLDPAFGFATFESYARLEFGHGANDAQALEAQRNVGTAIGRLEGSLLLPQAKATRSLTHNFEDTFGTAGQPGAEGRAATVLGQLYGSVRNGLDADLANQLNNVRENGERNAAPFEAGAKLASYAAIGVAAIGREELAVPLEGGEKVLDAFADKAKALSYVPDGDVRQTFLAREQNVARTLAGGRSDQLKDRYDVGIATTTTQRAIEVANAQALENKERFEQQLPWARSHDNAYGRERPEREASVAAVEQYNAVNRSGDSLPVPRGPIADWDGKRSLHGTLLQVDRDDYLVHTGRGSYVAVPAEALLGRPENGVYTVIERGGNFTQISAHPIGLGLGG